MFFDKNVYQAVAFLVQISLIKCLVSQDQMHRAQNVRLLFAFKSNFILTIEELNIYITFMIVTVKSLLIGVVSSFCKYRQPLTV